jgi:argininosuccinate lyase
MLERDHGRLHGLPPAHERVPPGRRGARRHHLPHRPRDTTAALGFDRPDDATPWTACLDRDFAIEFAAFAALLLTHLSRMAEELVLWTSAQFGFVELPDRFCTGSSSCRRRKIPTCRNWSAARPAASTGIWSRS